jgi:ADP-ribosylglycohydrolase
MTRAGPFHASVSGYEHELKGLMRIDSVTVMAEAFERAVLSLEGLALGDAFGESFFAEDAVHRLQTRRPSAGPWRWTDDTAMAVSIVETLARRGKIDQDELAARFVRRYWAEPDRGYGSATHSGLSAIRAGRDWRSVAAGHFGGQGSYGNGAAMRASVIGAWFSDDLDRVTSEARLSAEVTHTHPEGVAGAIAVALAAGLACREDCPSGERYIEAVLDLVPESELKERARGALLLPASLPIERVVSVLGNGSRVSAQDTVPLVLWCAAAHPDNYEEALWLTVSALGDRDTTCAMVGGIVACRVDRHGLPAQWLDRREPLPPLDTGPRTAIG